MKHQFSIRNLIIVTTVFAVFFAFCRFTLMTLEHEQRRIHDDDKEIAKFVTDLGGFVSNRTRDKHVSGIVLDDTNLDDSGLEFVLSAKHLRWIDICGTNVTDGSIPAIVRHKCLRGINVARSPISAKKLACAALANKSMISVSD